MLGAGAVVGLEGCQDGLLGELLFNAHQVGGLGLLFHRCVILLLGRSARKAQLAGETVHAGDLLGSRVVLGVVGVHDCVWLAA